MPATGSRITNLAFAGFTGNAVTLDNVKNATVSGITISGSGTGLFLTGNLEGTTIQGTTLSLNSYGMRLSSAQKATIGGRSQEQRNTIAGASRAGIYARGFCTGTQVIGTTFVATPPTRVRLDVRSSRGLRISGTVIQRAPTPTVASARTPFAGR